MMMKIIIAGTRTFNNYELLCQKCDDALRLQDQVEVVSGTASGADKLGEQYAKEKGYNIKQFPADWNKHGKSAGYIRNEEMAVYSDALIAFWDGQSKGTKHMIDLANKHGLKVKVVNYNLPEPPKRLLMGEAFMMCSDCGGKLYSFDGDQDRGRPCPHPQKCSEERERLQCS